MIPISELESHNLLLANNGDAAGAGSAGGMPANASGPFSSLARSQSGTPGGVPPAPTPGPGEATPPEGQPVSPPVQAPQQAPGAAVAPQPGVPATPQPGVPPAAPVMAPAPTAAPQQVPPPAAVPTAPQQVPPVTPAAVPAAPVVPGQVAPGVPPQAVPVAGAPTAPAAQPAAAAPGVAPAPVSPVPPTPPPAGLRYYWDAHPFWRAAAIVVGLAIIGLLVWLLLLRDNSSTVSVVPGGPPVIYTPTELAGFSEDIGQPIYWAGPISDTRLEVTETTAQLVFLRYLTGVAAAGDPSTQFVTVGTYPVVNGYDALRKWARHQGATQRRVPSGGVAVSVPGSPTSVFFADPTRPVQVEVYDPQPGQALRMVMAGQVKPIAPGVQGTASSQSVVPGAGTVTPGGTAAPSSSGTVTPSATPTAVPSG